MDLRSALALAYLDGLHRKAREEAARRPTDTVRLDTPDRPRTVPLRPNGGAAWRCGCVEPRRNHAAGWCHRG